MTIMLGGMQLVLVLVLVIGPVSKWEIVGYVEPGATRGTIAYATRWFELSACV
jgi:hypothetical protein